MAHRNIVYNIRAIDETVHTGAGEATYKEEGLVGIVDGLHSFRTFPALVAQSPDHLPSATHLLLGVPQINDLESNVMSIYRKHRRLPLQSDDEDADFAFDTTLQCRLAEKDLLRWAQCNPEKTVGQTLYSHLDVDVNPALPPAEYHALQQAGADLPPFLTLPRASSRLSITLLLI